MSEIRTICVYCGSGPGGDPVYMTEAARFGELMAREGVGLVYGGGSRGLMGAVAGAVLANGGRVTGIIPDFLQSKEKTQTGAQEIIITPDMHSRKQIMFDRADAFVALPGGIGTLEELVEQLTWKQLGRHPKPILMANIGGFWDPLLALLEHMVKSDFIHTLHQFNYLIAQSADEIIPMLRTAAQQVAAKEPAADYDTLKKM